MSAPTLPRYPQLAGPGRRVFHTLLAVVGWVLFVYWWWIVFRRVSSAEVRFTVLFIVIAMAVIVLLTIFWVMHNQRLDRKRTSRVRIRDDARPAAHDSVGREVQMAALSGEYQNAWVVRVSVEAGAKVYRIGTPYRDGQPHSDSGTAA
jgi:hypothetical protein